MNRLFRLIVLLTVAAATITPGRAAQEQAVVASAVVVPARVTRLSFLTSALVDAVAVEEGDSVSAGQMLVTLHTPDLEYSVVAAQEAFRARQAYAELQRYKRVLDIRKGKKFWDVVPPEVRQKADAEAESAQAALEVAQAQLAQSTLAAPFAATVASVHAVPGEYVPGGQVVMTLATLDSLQLETTDLGERDVTRIKPGAPAAIWIEALNQEVTGNVVRISPRADTVGGDVVFKVTIAFDRQPDQVFWGMTAEVTFDS